MPQDPNGQLDFFASFLTGPGGLVGTAQSDGSIDYYNSETAQIQAALNSPDVSPERKRALRQQQAQLDQQYYPQRVEAAQTRLQNAPNDAEALAAVQELERLQSQGGGNPGYNGGATGLAPIYDNGRTTYDPTNEAEIRAAWEAGPKFQGISYEDYKRQVQQANPNGELRYTSDLTQPDGTPSTYGGFNKLGAQLTGIDQTALNNAQIQRSADLGYFDNVTGRAIGDVENRNNFTDAANSALLARQLQSDNEAKALATGYTNQLIDETKTTNARSDASLARYTGAVDTANASNLQALDAYKAGIAPYQHEIAGTTYTPISADAEGLGYQRQALGMGQNIYGGGLDYTSQAAQAYADPEDVARTLEGLSLLQDNALNGGAEQKTNLEHARQELATGGDRQREVYGRYEAISNPEMTAAERAILSQSQRQYALQDKANRDAVTSDLEARGILSGAGVIAGQQTAQQRLGEERVAGTLGAQAQAVQRALIGLQGMQSTAQQLRQGEQNALQLEQAAANALRAGDLAAAQAYTAAAQRQREQGFQEEYSRGVAADNTAANNQRTRLGGAQIYATQANQIRADNDAINMFNTNQQGITDRYNTTFKQNEYTRLTGLQQDTLNNTVGTNQTNLGNERVLNSDTQGALGDQWGRTNTALQTGIGTAFANNGIDTRYTGIAMGENERSRAAQERLSGTKMGTATARTGISDTTNQQVQDALRKLQGNKVDIYGLNSVG